MWPGSLSLQAELLQDTRGSCLSSCAWVKDFALDCVSAAVLHRPHLSRFAMVALGLLTVILMSLLMYQRILCCGEC